MMFKRIQTGLNLDFSDMSFKETGSSVSKHISHVFSLFGGDVEINAGCWYVSLNQKVIEHTNSLRYLRIHFDRMLTCKTQVRSTKLRCKKGLSTLKAMAFKGIEQHHLSCCIRVCDSESLTIVWVLQTRHSLTCWSSTGCKTNPRESFWEQQRTHPLRKCATYWACHPWKKDIRCSKSKRISMWCTIPESTTQSCQRRKGV